MERDFLDQLTPVTTDYAATEIAYPEEASLADGGGSSQGSGPSELQSGLYSYNNLHVRESETCGQAAIATLTDFWRRNPYKLPAAVTGRDGRKHFENEAFVGAITADFPPANFFGVSCTTPEIIERALHRFGLQTERLAPIAFSNGDEARAALTQWIQQKRTPVIALLDMPKLWPKGYGAYTLHWGVIYSVGRNGVAMASWHRNFGIDWQRFMDSWHCAGLPAGLNFLQLRISG